MFRCSPTFGLKIACGLASIATIGSLYYSNWMALLPCGLCWYQRICLFPLVLILGLAARRRRIEIVPYVLPQICLGLLLSLIHLFAFQWPILSRCEGKQCIPSYAFPLPLLASLTFALLGAILWISFIKQRPKDW